MTSRELKKQQAAKRLLMTVDRAIRACDEAKRARDELAALPEDNKS